MKKDLHHPHLIKVAYGKAIRTSSAMSTHCLHTVWLGSQLNVCLHLAIESTVILIAAWTPDWNSNLYWPSVTESGQPKPLVSLLAVPRVPCINHQQLHHPQCRRSVPGLQRARRGSWGQSRPDLDWTRCQRQDNFWQPRLELDWTRWHCQRQDSFWQSRLELDWTPWYCQRQDNFTLKVKTLP